MKIKWLGHASFLIAASNGTKVITDPFGDYPGLRYSPIEEEADVMVISHSHGDHMGGGVKGSPIEVIGVGTTPAAGIVFRGIETYHDASRGEERGANTVFCFNVDGANLCHLGDLGHELSDSQTAEIGTVDVLFVPVGGFFTIDAGQATSVCASLRPKVVIPMHYKTEKCDFPIDGVDRFLEGKSNVRRVNGSEMELRADELPVEMQVIVLTPAQ